MKLNALIVEDEKHNQEILKGLLTEFCEGIDIVGIAANVEDAVRLIRERRPDVVFLDIELQTGSGFDVLEQVKGIAPEVIFTTAFEHYAIKAIKMSSLDYLLKPIDLEELQEAVEKAKRAKNKPGYGEQLESLLQNLRIPQSDHVKLCLNTAEGMEFVNSRDLRYLKADGSYTQFHPISGVPILVSKHLKEYERLLPPSDFMRVHNSYLINLREVKRYVKADGGYILMKNEAHIPVSRSKKEEFLMRMQGLPPQ